MPYVRKKPTLNLSFLDPVPLVSRLDAKAYDRTLKRRTTVRKWHARTYVPRERVELYPANLEERIAAMREAKMLRFSLTGRFAFPEGTTQFVPLPGDQEVPNAAE